jgi:hypothetical protein
VLQVPLLLFASPVWIWLHRLGGPGLILLGLVDNSVIPLPGSMDVFVILLLSERLHNRAPNFGMLRAPDVTGFVVRHAHRLSPVRAKLMVTALRSFFRYLQYREAMSTDLTGCVPTVPNWSFSTLPRFLPVIKHIGSRGARDRFARKPEAGTSSRINFSFRLLQSPALMPHTVTEPR